MDWTAGTMPRPAIQALSCALDEWRGTPYASGQSMRGRGADCIGAPFGVIDQLEGTRRTYRPEFPGDAAMHDSAGAFAALRRLLTLYGDSERLRAAPSERLEVEPGDLVVCGAVGGGPGHLMMVGPRRNELWHATAGAGFHQSGWALFTHQRLIGAWRLGGKHSWS
jgi:cell wall-associated NlpC family hydrolase